jgi:hypothetical protein
MKKLTKEQQKELAEILAELAKELGLSRRELFSQINEAAEGLHPENN